MKIRPSHFNHNNIGCSSFSKNKEHYNFVLPFTSFHFFRLCRFFWFCGKWSTRLRLSMRFVRLFSWTLQPATMTNSSKACSLGVFQCFSSLFMVLFQFRCSSSCLLFLAQLSLWTLPEAELLHMLLPWTCP